MFRTVPLSIIRSFSLYTQQWYMSYRYADSLRAGSWSCGWIPVIKSTGCTNFSNSFLEWNSTCFGQFLCPSSGVFHCTHSNGMLYRFADSYRAGSGSCSQAVCISVWRIPLLCVQWKTPDDGQRNCPKRVEFHSKNEFEKLVHLVDFITGIQPSVFHPVTTLKL